MISLTVLSLLACLSREEIHKAMPTEPMMRQCKAEKAFIDVMIDFVVDPGGRPESIKLTPRRGEPARYLNCLEEKLRAAKFPQCRKRTEVHYPFRLEGIAP
jgi:hypothetical protein